MRRFAAQEDQFLRDNYLTIPAKRMSRMLGRAEAVARQRMARIGLVVPREIIEQRIIDSRIKKGSTPPNKGKKWDEVMSKEAQQNCRRTTFPKGNLPHNTQYDGAIRVRADKSGISYQYIRVSLGKWELLHRFVWTMLKGKIPPKHLVVFKDGNQGNCNIDNLELITQAENMKRNTYHNYPKEIALMVQLRGALNRQINKHLKTLRNEK
jgi:hypothetical protein